MTSPDPHEHALAGLHAAIEYARVQYAGMSGAAPVADVQAALEAIRNECAAGGFDILGALATISLRAATLACYASAAAWPDRQPLTIAQFLAELESELVPPDDATSA